MEAACRGAGAEGGESLGVLVEGPGEPNAWVTRAVREPDLSARLRRLLRETESAVFLPRGLGTLVEVTFFAESVAKGQVPPRPLVFFGESWRALATTAVAEASGPGAASLAACVRFAATPEAAVALALPAQ
jgi:predicted Rossmann-fold nucleotide-binding protein